MAETLGSLLDKFTIKVIREYHITEMIDRGSEKFTKEELQGRLALLQKQKKETMNEIDTYVKAAFSNEMPLRDEKIKLYNARNVMDAIGDVRGIADAIDGLTKKNLEIWHLEDEARRTDVPLDYIGTIKRKIDPANQQRNDFIDKIDELFALAVTQARSGMNNA